jgi:chemotaxis protein methyltransferase CheR
MWQPGTFAAPALSDEVWGRLSPLIENEIGIRMPIEKKTLLQNRLLRRIKYLELGSYEEYCDFLFSAEGRRTEMTPFLNEITTNKTFFFREFRHFEILSDRILPEFVRKNTRPGEPIRIWSSGCSTGEEVYSIACIIQEFMRLEGMQVNYEILGTDISTRVLWHAYNAIYEEQQVLPVAPDLRNRYFLVSKNKERRMLRVAPELRSHVKFRKVNLMDEVYPFAHSFDVIFCRNVLIYFSREDIRKIVSRSLGFLKSGGYFLTGHADSIQGADAPLRRIEPSVHQKV